MIRKIWKVVVFVCVAQWVQAQMPHEVLLLVNKNSQPSLKVANTFAAVRQIPKRNIVMLDIPESAYGGTATITPEQFKALIWTPANAQAQERGIDEQILAWVYSVDFPIRIETDPYDRKQMSVGGLTFLRGRMPGLDLVEKGKYLSKLFAGPNDRLPITLPALSFSLQKNGLGMTAKVPPEAAYLQGGLGRRMPLPNMMLGYTGEKGTDVDTVIQTILRGLQSDFRGQTKGIYFVESEDVRSTCRDWQYPAAVHELKQRQITATMTTNFPAEAENVMGLLMGAEKVDPSSIKSFAPGAMAEHLTSWSAEFQKGQSKATEWLKAGATATAGAVVEPYSNPNKFPSARFFVHYTSGCTMLESFYQSIACPLQSLLLGDPMARPYAPPVGVRVLGADSIDQEFTYAASAQSALKDALYNYVFLLDGKIVGKPSEDSSCFIDARKLADGYHELRVAAYIRHRILFSGMGMKAFMVNRKGRSVEIHPSIESIEKHKHGLKVKIGGEEKPQSLKLVCGERVLDTKKFADDAAVVLDEKMIGEGPNSVRVLAVYEDGMEVSSKPMGFEIAFAKK